MTGFITGVFIGLGIIAYLAIAYVCAVDMARRVKRCWPRQRFDSGDAAIVIILAGLLWPVGHPTGLLSIRIHETPRDGQRWYHRFLRIDP